MTYDEALTYTERINELNNWYSLNSRPNKKDYKKNKDGYQKDLKRYLQVCDSLDNFGFFLHPMRLLKILNQNIKKDQSLIIKLVSIVHTCIKQIQLKEWFILIGATEIHLFGKMIMKSVSLTYIPLHLLMVPYLQLPQMLKLIKNQVLLFLRI